MGQFRSTYYDQTHSYRLLDNTIIMAPRSAGPVCRLTFSSSTEARSTLRWLINKAQLRKGEQVRAN